METAHSRLINLYDIAPTGYLTLNGEGVVLEANHAFAALLGVERANLYNKPLCHYIVTHDQACYELFRKRLFEQHEPEMCKLRLVKDNGSYIWTRLDAVTMLGGDNTELCKVVVSDLTMRKQAEEMLLESMERYLRITETLTDYFYTVRIENGIAVETIQSQSCEKVTGYTQEEFAADPYLWINMIAAEDRELVLLRVQQIVEGENIPVIEHRIIRKDGETRWVSDTIIQFRDDAGNLLSYDGVIKDITERKLAEENRLKLEQQFQETQKLESLGVLTGGIAHDFNNILTIILGHCYILKDEIESGSMDVSLVQKIEAAANRAADLCQQMLAYAGESPLIKTDINLSLLIEEMLKMLRAVIKKNVTVKVDLSSDSHMISADNSQMQQMLMNLIINAAEAIGDKHGTINITLSKTTFSEEEEETDCFGTPITAGSYICLEVSDNGCGMDMETQRRIFEPFYTTKFKGRGLGLSAMHGIIRSHNGALQLSSRPGKGTTFKVYIPVSDKADDIACSSTGKQISSEKGEGTILLVDDEETLLFIGSAFLEKRGYAVVTAVNGREAIDIYHQQESTIDLVLLDLLMPEMGGFETYNVLRALSPTLPIIICSGCSNDEVLPVIMDDAYTDFVTKPYKADQLLSSLRQMLKKEL